MLGPLSLNFFITFPKTDVGPIAWRVDLSKWNNRNIPGFKPYAKLPLDLGTSDDDAYL
jgi:hypothetical protein